MEMDERKTDIVYGKEFATKRFTGKDMKTAYITGMKWYATNILARNDLGHVQVSVEKKGQTEIVLHLFATMEEQKVHDRHCAVCRETHSTLFRSENCNCAWCNTNAYQRRADDMIRTLMEHCKAAIRGQL